MDYAGRTPRNGNIPMAAPPSTLGSPYVYSGYMDQARQNGSAGSAGEPSPPVIGSQPAGRNNAGIRPISMFPNAAYSMSSPYMAPLPPGPPAGADQQHAMTAPNTATSDRSFHAIMIGDNNHALPRAQPNNTAAAAFIHPDVQMRPKHSANAGRSGSTADIYGGSLSSSVPSGSPFLHSELIRRQDASGSSQAYSRIAYPPLDASAPSNDSYSALSPGTGPPHHARTASHHYSQLPHDAAAEMQQRNSESAMAYAGVPPVAMGGTLRSTASDMSLSHQTAEPVYQALSMGTVGARDTSAGAPQLYPVSQPGLPPAGPASATLSVYTSGDPSPMVGRGRGRQRLHHAYDYPEASTSDRFSPDVSPIVATSGAGLQPPPNMRQALSTNNAGEYISGAALRHQSSSNLSAQMHSQQGSMNSGYGSSNHSPSMDMQAADAAAAVSTRTSAYNYPEVGYSPKRSTGPYGSQQRTASAAWSDRDHPESAMDMNDSSEGGTADGAAAGSGHARASMSSAGDGVQPHDYTNASMAHIRWNPASSGSPLRQEISVAGQHVAEGSSGTLPLLSVNGPVTQASSSLAHIYGTLPRTSYAMRGTVPDGGAHAQSLAEAQHTAASSPGQQQQQQPWPRISPQTIAQQQQQQHAHSDSPRVQTQTTAGPVADYYMLQSPTEQSFTEPQTPRADATSLLPMVEVGQGAHAPAANNMDEINAHSQEYLHRRRRRLTQTMHNRQRSGSAADPAARLSASRLNAALSMSSPSVHSHGSNRSMEDAHIAEQSPYGYQSAQPVSSVYQSMPLSAAAYSGAPSNYTPADSQASMQAHLQAQAQLQAHAQAQLQAQAQAQAQLQAQAQAQAQLQARAQAQAQAEYMQRLQAEQERLQQEQMRQAIEQQQQQQQLQIKLAQEQELLRFRNYRPLLSLTVDIVETYRKCHPEFYYESARRPRRVLTHPSDGVKNDGFDNQNSDYILYVNDVIGEKEGHQYLIMEMLGSGTFGQVVKCQNLKTGDLVAVKVIKNKTAYYNQSMMEVQMLDLLNKKYDIDDRHHILRLKEWFVFRNHLVFVNELLSINLYDLLKQNQYQGLSTNLVRVLVQQILDAMIVLNKAQIIHADLKPENILLEGMEKPVIKVIDFGSACFEWQTTFTYIQSRFYRSPEILLGLPYSSRIDMWSLGCIVAELYLGLPLFPGSSEYNQLSRIVDLLGTPPRVMLEKARRTDEFFNYLGPSTWDFKPMEQFSRERNTEEKESKRYFNATTLEELITTYPIRRRMTEPEQEREYQSRFALIDFLRGLLQLDPNRRWSPQQASMHPFITGEALTGSFVPPPISRDPHDPSGATGPYGAAPGDSSGAHHASQTGGGYGQAHTIGYSASRFSGGSGSNGHTAHVPYGGNTSASLFSHAPSPPQPAVSLPGAHDTSGLTWAHQENRPHDPGDSGRGSGGVLSIPGSFPVKSTASHPSQTSQHDGRGRQRATTLGHAGGLASASRIPAESAGGYSYQQPESASGFLGVDPSTSHICGSPTAGGESRDAPGRLDISQSSSEYSADNASHGWASHSDTNYNSNYPSSSSGSNGTRAGSLYEYKVAGPSTSRHYLVNERQQQRLLQQRQLYRSEFGGGSAAVDTSSMGDTQSGSRPDSMILPGSAQRCESLHTSPQQIASAAPAPSQPALGGPTAKPCLPVYAMRLKPSPALRSTAGARLVSNFSPLTLPSTPGSSGYSRRYASSAYDERCSAEPEMVQQFIDLGTSYEEGEDIGHNIDNVSASGSEQGGSRFSEESELSRPLTQMRGSETSLSLHSAASDRDDASSHGCGPDDADYDALSDSDLSSAGGSGCKYSGAPKLGRHTRSDNRWQKLPIPQPAQRKHGVGSTKPSSLPYALSHSLDRTLAEAQHSIYLMPRYAACSQSILGSSGSLYSGGRRASEALSSDLAAKENMQPLALGSDEDWRSDSFDLHDVVDDGSVISQDIVSGSESPPNGQELDEVTDGFVRLDVGRGSSESDSDSQSSALFGSIGRYSESSGLSDADGGDRANQDTVLYVGRRRPGQDSTDASTLLKERGLGTPQSRLSAQDLATMGDRARTSLDSLRLSPSPIPQSIRCAVAATYPQKIMKMSQQERSDRPALLKDSLRMVASLRRMGKWRNADPVQTGDDVSRANQFFYDPVIIAMSPRLMPQPGQPS